MIELVAFLGNPGPEYARNRHNAGWLLAERLPFFPGLSWQSKYKGRYASLSGEKLLSLEAPASKRPVSEAPVLETPVSGTPVSGTLAPESLGVKPPVSAEFPPRFHFIMPGTYMNLSGDAVYEAASFFKIPPGRILVVHDELELPLGTAAIKFSGGLGGHNGLRSMKARFGTADFWRLRVGIGRPNHDDISGWVLSDFFVGEISVLDQVLAACSDSLIEALIRGPESLLPAWNKKKITDTA
jgi:PTH1 family peptidyl-tRNA hydrolase